MGNATLKAALVEDGLIALGPMGSATPKAEFIIMGDTMPKEDLGVEARDDLGDAGALPFGTGVDMATVITFGDRDLCLATLLGNWLTTKGMPI